MVSAARLGIVAAAWFSALSLLLRRMTEPRAVDVACEAARGTVATHADISSPCFEAIGGICPRAGARSFAPRISGVEFFDVEFLNNGVHTVSVASQDLSECDGMRETSVSHATHHWSSSACSCGCPLHGAAESCSAAVRVFLQPPFDQQRRRGLGSARARRRRPVAAALVLARDQRATGGPAGRQWLFGTSIHG